MAKRYYIYSYWTDVRDVIEDIRCSVLPSVASLRFSTDDPISVIDYSSANWGNYPLQLGVKVIKKKPYLAQHTGLTEFRRNALSRTFDILEEANNSNCTQIVAVDADILWLDQVEEECSDINFLKFSHNANNGCYLMQKDCQFVKEAQKHTRRAVQDTQFVQYMQNRCQYPWFNDELIFSYTYLECPELVSKLPFAYNNVLDQMFDNPPLLTPKNIHVIRGTVPNDLYDKRCVCAAMISEVRKRILCLPQFLERFNVEPVSLKRFLASGINEFHQRLYML